jgi:hypothetical protein
MSAPWTPDPCGDDAGWKGVTVCRRPYGVGPYGMGPYGRCAIVGGGVWGQETPCAPFSQQAPLAPTPWGRRRG